MKRALILLTWVSVVTGCRTGAPLDAGDASPMSLQGANGGAPAAAGPCQPADCRSAPLPDLPCPGGAAAQATCTRGNDGRCNWAMPRCASAASPDAAGPAPVTCGATRCPGGQVCCNISCGICTPPGGACIQTICAAPADAAAPAAAPQPPTCRVDADCRLFDDYCTGCDCRALPARAADPTCSGPGVRCLRQPCADRSAACDNGRCVVRTGSAGP